jgi:hypothetical protein
MDSCIEIRISRLFEDIVTISQGNKTSKELIMIAVMVADGPKITAPNLLLVSLDIIQHDTGPAVIYTISYSIPEYGLSQICIFARPTR